MDIRAETVQSLKQVIEMHERSLSSLKKQLEDGPPVSTLSRKTLIDTAKTIVSGAKLISQYTRVLAS